MFIYSYMCLYSLYVLIMLVFQHLLFICLNYASFQHLLFICLNCASFPIGYLTSASIGFLNSTIHDEGPET